MTHAEQFLTDIEAFLERTGMAASAFGKSAVGDPNFVGDLRDGRKPNLGLVDRIHEFMRANETNSERATS